MSPMVTITRDLDNLVEESGADKINSAYSTAEYDESFENIKFGLIASSMQKAKYNGCSFENCEFSGLNMKYAKFDDAEFVDCDFGLAQLDGVTAQNSSFYGDDVYWCEHGSCRLFSEQFCLCRVQWSEHILGVFRKERSS